jgi:hypothetical protein
MTRIFNDVPALIAKVRAETERRIEGYTRNMRENAEKTIMRIQENAPLYPQLVAIAGEHCVSVPYWADGADITVSLGDWPAKNRKTARKEFAAKLTALRALLGRPIKSPTEVLKRRKGSRTDKVVVVAKYERYPGVEVQWRGPLKDGGNCRVEIIRVPARVERHVVCNR